MRSKFVKLTVLVLLAGSVSQLADAKPKRHSRPPAPASGAIQAPPALSVGRSAGSWKIVHYTIAFDGTGVSGDMAGLVAVGKSSVGKKQIEGPVCLSAESAAKDNLGARLREIISFGPEWTVVRSQVTDGKVDFFATMNDPGLGKSEMTITGTISPTKTDLVLTTDGYQPAPGKGHIHTVMKQENSRVGDCTPDEDGWSG